mgnify:CR=1 FL=1
MKINRALAMALAASSMAVAVPAAAAADVERAVAPVEKTSELGPGASVIALIAVVAGLVLLSDVLEDDETPVSV